MQPEWVCESQLKGLDFQVNQLMENMMKYDFLDEHILKQGHQFRMNPNPFAFGNGFGN